MPPQNECFRSWGPLSIVGNSTSQEDSVLHQKTEVPPYYHVIGVYLPSQSATEKHNQENKAHKPLRTTWISQKNVSAMFDNDTIALKQNALFTWSRRIARAKDHGLFNLNYPQVNGVVKSDHSQTSLQFCFKC